MLTGFMKWGDGFEYKTPYANYKTGWELLNGRGQEYSYGPEKLLKTTSLGSDPNTKCIWLLYKVESEFDMLRVIPSKIRLGILLKSRDFILQTK